MKENFIFPAANENKQRNIYIGDTVRTWCTDCGGLREKRFTGAGLVCLGCEESETKRSSERINDGKRKHD